MTGLLWLTQETPDPTRGGGALRQAGLLRALAEQVPVDLVVAGDPPSAAVADAMRRVVVVPPPPPGGRPTRLRGALAVVDRRHVPEVDAARAVRHRMLDAVEALDARPDLTVVTHLPLAPLLRDLPGRTAFHPFHVVGAQLADEALHAGGLRALRLRRYAANATRLEADAVDAADLTVAVSDLDARQLARPGRRVVVSPNAVDVDPADPPPRPHEPVVLFPGSLDYAPNADGATWLVRDIWPLVRAEAPSARLQIVGRSPRPAVLALDGRDGVEVHADVPAMAPWFSAARVVAVPLRFGTGTRVKALEAMAAGRPVVGTSTGLAGLGLEDGVDAAIADDDAGLARRIVDALGPAGDRLVAPARARVEALHTWAAATAPFLAELSTLRGTA